MNTLVKKSELLEILRENRTAHAAIFSEAVEGFRKRAQEVLNDELARIEKGSKERVYVLLAAPVNQTKDYDRAIKMLELNQEELISLSESEAAQYVMDDWSWKDQFLTTNSAYSVTAAKMSSDA